MVTRIKANIVIVVIIVFALLIVTTTTLRLRPKPVMVTNAKTTEAVTATITTMIGTTIADFDKPATNYAGPLDKADRIIIAALIDTMGGDETSRRAVVDIIYNRHVAPIEWFGESIKSIVTKQDQFPYDPECQPSQMALELVDNELQNILDGSPLIPEGYYFFFIEENSIVPFRYENGGLGSPGDKIVTYNLN